MDLLINSDYGGYYYDLFYRLSFLICLAIFLLESWRRRYPFPTILLIAATTIFFALLGSKVSAVSLDEWRAFLSTGAPLSLEGKSSFGALLFGWMGTGLAQRILGFKRSVLDLYLLAIPVTLIFQRLGCLMAGCCYGNPTTLPWAMEYGSSHVAWKIHYAQGLIDGMSERSLAIHPVPVYFILAFLLGILLVFRFRHRLRANGNQTLLMLILLFGFRFVIEFFRDPITNHGLGETFWGIKQIQWLLLLAVLLFSAILSLREHRYQLTVESDTRNMEKQLPRKLVLWAIPLTGLLLLPGWFSFSEIIIINAHILFATLALAWTAYHQLTHPRLRGITTVLLVAALFSMGQTYQNLPVENQTDQPKIIQSISFGFMEGRNSYGYDQRGSAIPGTNRYDSNGCITGREYYTDHYEAGPYFTAVGASFERLKKKNPELYKGVMMGANLTTYNLRKNGVETERITDFGLLVGYSWWHARYRIDIGTQIGSVRHLGGNPIKSKLIPMANLRLGPRDLLFFEAGMGSDLPFGPTTSFWKVGGGLGLPVFGLKYKAGVAFGLTNLGEDKVLYLSPHLPLWDIELQPVFRFSKRQDINNFGLIMRWNIDGPEPF